jgi:hypothetical protein
MPVPPCAQGDEGELELTGTESVLEVVLSLANSGGSMTPGSSLHFQALVIEHSWEVWTNYSMGVSEFRGYTTQVMPGQQLNWSMEYGDAGYIQRPISRTAMVKLMQWSFKEHRDQG